MAAESQSIVPQAHLNLLAVVPVVCAQVGTVAQRSLLDMSQKSPEVADVQAPEAPQTQGAALAVTPST